MDSYQRWIVAVGAAALVFGNVVTTMTALPEEGKDFLPLNGYEQRKFQLGFKFVF